MKPVYQKEPDECFRAAIASMLELPLEKVPYVDPDQSRKTWIAMWNVWLRTLGLKAVETQQARYITSGLRIGVVRSRRTKGNTHAVILHKGVIIHDPIPGVNPYIDRRKPISCFILKKV